MPEKLTEVLYVRVGKTLKKVIKKMRGEIDEAVFVRGILEEKADRYQKLFEKS